MTYVRERRPRFFSRPRVRSEEIDYKNLEVLRRFVSDRGKIVPRKTTRIKGRQQRLVSKAIKRARHLALLPFCTYHK